MLFIYSPKKESLIHFILKNPNFYRNLEKVLSIITFLVCFSQKYYKKK